jgi:hypothetical protein
MQTQQYEISGFSRELDEICALLGYYTVYSGNSLPTFWDDMSIPSSRTTVRYHLQDLEDGTERLSPNVCKELPLYAA